MVNLTCFPWQTVPLKIEASTFKSHVTGQNKEAVLYVRKIKGQRSVVFCKLNCKLCITNTVFTTA